MTEYIKKHEVARIKVDDLNAGSNNKQIKEINPNGQAVNTWHHMLNLDQVAQYSGFDFLYLWWDEPKREIVIFGSENKIVDPA